MNDPWADLRVLARTARSPLLGRARGTDVISWHFACRPERIEALLAERDTLLEALDHIAYPTLDFNDECPYCGSDDDSHGDHCATTQARATLARIGQDGA
jgi:hypothetical protein